MATKVDKSTQDRKLSILLAKREAIFRIMQNIFELSRDLNVLIDVEKREHFLDESSQIDSLRTRYESIVDEYNTRLLELDSETIPDYNCLYAFETLYSRVKRIQAKCSTSTSEMHNATSSLLKDKPKLAPISILDFDGDIKSFQMFYTTFKSVVHDNVSLTDAEKLFYLLPRLQGKAKSAIAGISPCAENYNLILQTLVNRFDDKRMLASAYLNELFNYKGFQSPSAANFESFIDRFAGSVSALKNLKLDNLADLIILYIAMQKIDTETVRAFEIKCGKNIPNFDEFVEFITTRAKVFERTCDISDSSSTRQNKNIKSMKGRDSQLNNKTSGTAPKYQAYVSMVDKPTVLSKCLCKNISHIHLYKCVDFNKLTSPQERYKCVKEKNGCVNCLSLAHKVSQCDNSPQCFCGSKHNKRLHFNQEREVPTDKTVTSSQELVSNPVASVRTDVALCATNGGASTSATTCNHGITSDNYNGPNQQLTVLLATAQIAVYDSNSKRQIIRVLLDSASQADFLSRECCERLGLESLNTERTIVKGFGGIEKIVQSNTVNLKFHSRFDDNVSFNISPLVVDKVTDKLPTAVVDTSGLSHLQDVPLADPSFGTPDKIDGLIGASLFPHLLLPDCDTFAPRREPFTPVALNTALGIVLMGNAPTLSTVNTHSALTCCFIQNPSAIDSLIKRFWELEEISSTSVQHPDDAECEDFYTSTTIRDPATGRYVVGLPFKEDVCSLGNSMDIAKKRFLCLERKLQALPKLRLAYDDVIKNYLSKDYISAAPIYDTRDPYPVYVMPHTGILREEKSTKLRMVVDASCRTSSGRALNDLLHSGPNLQGDLFKILLNFRLHSIAMTADCREQFLQIIMREADRRYQCFLYRFNPQDPLTLYQFNRVCFGLTSSPYHALRTVRQLVKDDGAKYPLASNIVLPALYMDDVAFSLPNEQEAVAASQQMIELFKGAQWALIKWNSNSPEVLDNLPASHKLPTEVEFDKTMHHKILGLHWCTSDDSFYFKISAPDDTTCTKRSILSTVARLWDIMGFVAPTVVYAKILIKMLWQLNLDWDTIAPPYIIKMWKQFCDELPALNKIRIPRHVGVTKDCEVTLLGLSDASQVAFGAVIYLHVSTPWGNTVRLVCAKSKVSPTKPHSIARLELLGGVLLAKLLRTVYDSYAENIPIQATYAFLDSKVALYWIKSSPHRWQPFVANRVVQITENISADNFYHCPGTENSADILSRGVTPEKLVSDPLWLHGPPWASMNPSQWPLKTLEGQFIHDIPEQKVLAHPVYTPEREQCALYELAQRTSSWSKLLRITVYVCRFLKLLHRRGTSTVSADDLNFAENKILRVLQNRYFANEYHKIQNNLSCSPTFNRLRPFIQNGLIRVGGRLANSGLEFDNMHPIVLPRNDHVVNIIIDYYHIKHLHAGPELLIALLRQRYWILSARRIIRYRVYKCNTCFRFKPRATFPLMADLPDIRTRPALKAFSFTGCDYAGPIQYVPVRRRGTHSQKAYIVLFTCLTTRATHIEVATSLSTPCFLAALKRFLSRRGPVQELHTDRGTNFQGAASYIRDLYKFLRHEYYPKLEQECAENRITWKFLCPGSPHKGGAWESMIKMTKTILFKVIGQQLLSYEELCTVLTQVECLLNSRPLTVLSSDPAEPSALTPSHFLHTAPLFSLPAPDVSSDINLRDRHTLIDKLVQSFWNRWRLEYLHNLQARQKWNVPSMPIVPGTIVVVINDNMPPLAWPLAIVEKVHYSKDGIIRVATVRISGKSYLRPVVRLCPLPTQ